MARKHDRFYRSITRTVLRWYSELSDGMVQLERGQTFDVRILDYKMDVDKVMSMFPEREMAAIMLVHLDGLTHAQALMVAGLPSPRPDLLVEDLESKLGQAFYRKRLHAFMEYVDYFR